MICECPLYGDLLNSLFERAKPVIQNFDEFNVEEKTCDVLSNSGFVKITAKILYEILSRKRAFTYN